MYRIITSLFISGLVLGSGPCLATCGPLLISYVAGTQKNIIRSIGAYLLFSLSRISVYAVLGLFVFFFGQAISKYIFTHSSQKYIFLCAGLFIVIIGCLIAIGRNPGNKFCRRVQGFFLKKDAKTIFIFGLIIGIIPCLPLLSVLSYVGLASKTWRDSLVYSLSFGLGTIISPLFAIVALAGFIPKIIMSNRVISNIFNAICGLIIIYLGERLIMRAF